MSRTEQDFWDDAALILLSRGYSTAVANDEATALVELREEGIEQRRDARAKALVAALAPTEAEIELAKVRRIDAIKAYRERTGEGLADSKNAIERALADLAEP
jgi:ribosomal protein L7/L12